MSNVHPINENILLYLGYKYPEGKVILIKVTDYKKGYWAEAPIESLQQVEDLINALCLIIVNSNLFTLQQREKLSEHLVWWSKNLILERREKK